MLGIRFISLFSHSFWTFSPLFFIDFYFPFLFGHIFFSQFFFNSFLFNRGHILDFFQIFFIYFGQTSIENFCQGERNWEKHSGLKWIHYTTLAQKCCILVEKNRKEVAWLGFELTTFMLEFESADHHSMDPSWWIHIL